MHRLRAVALGSCVSAALAASAAARAEDPPAAAPKPAPVTLTLVAAPGRPVKFVQTMKARQTTQIGKSELRVGADVTTEFGIEVKERAADGTWKAVVRYGRIRGRLETPTFGTHDVDSSAPLPEDMAALSLTLSTCAAGGHEFDVVLEGDGRVRSVGGIDRAIEATVKRNAGRKGLREVLVLALTEHKVREAIDHALIATPLPAQAVAVGAAWEDADSVPGLNSAVEMTAKVRHQVAEIVADAVLAKGSGDLEVRPGPVAPGGVARMAAIIGNAERKTATVTTECRISRADGLPVVATRSIALVLGLRDASKEKSLGTMEQDVQFRLERVTEWPSVAAAPVPDAPPQPPAPPKPPPVLPEDGTPK